MLSYVESAPRTQESSVLDSLKENLTSTKDCENVLLILEVEWIGKISAVQLWNTPDPNDQLEERSLPPSNPEEFICQWLSKALENRVVYGSLLSVAMTDLNGNRANLKQFFSAIAEGVPALLETDHSDWDFHWCSELNGANPKAIAVLLTKATRADISVSK